MFSLCAGCSNKSPETTHCMTSFQAYLHFVFCLCACLCVRVCESMRGALGCGLALLKFRKDLKTLAALETSFQFVEGNDAGACVAVQETSFFFFLNI